MTKKEIRDAIIAIIGPDTELQVADYNNIINEGDTNIIAKIIDERKDFFPDTETLSCTSSQTNITPIKTWNNITSIQIDFGDGNGFQSMIKASMDEVTLGQTERLIFHIWGNVILVPNFKKSFTLKIFGYIIPSPMATDGASPAYSSLLHPLLIIWGIGRALEASSSSEDFLNSKRKRDEFDERLLELLPSVIMKDMTNVKSLI